MLTDIRCRSAKAEAAPIKLTDAGGLHLLVKPSGSKTWRMKYRFGGKEKLLTFGPYPAVSLLEARERREAAKRQLREGIDPSVDRRQRRAARMADSVMTFETVARRWHAARAPHWAGRYAGQVLDRFENDVFPRIGALPITAITVPLVLETLQRIEKRGAIETAHRIRQHMSDVFLSAIAAGIATTDPAGGVRKALTKATTGRRPAVRTPARAIAVLRKVEGETAYAGTKLASRLLALTAVRPGVLRLAEKAEFEDLDGPSPIWRVPAARMKLTATQKRDADYEFIVPLAPQAVEVIRVAAAIASGPLLFPGSSNAHRPISDSTLGKLYLAAGWRGIHVPHGWRATFSTVMNERAALENRVGDRAIIDLMLAHVAPGVEPIYNRYGYMPRRREIALEWATLVTEGLVPAEQLLDGARGSSARNRRRARERRVDSAPGATDRAALHRPAHGDG